MKYTKFSNALFMTCLLGFVQIQIYFGEANHTTLSQKYFFFRISLNIHIGRHLNISFRYYRLLYLFLGYSASFFLSGVYDRSELLMISWKEAGLCKLYPERQSDTDLVVLRYCLSVVCVTRFLGFIYYELILSSDKAKRNIKMSTKLQLIVLDA